MKSKDIENILNTSGRLVLKNGILGEMYYIENDDGQRLPILKKQFYKFKETCLDKDESEQRWFREQTSTWYYWR